MLLSIKFYMGMECFTLGIVKRTSTGWTKDSNDILYNNLG